MSRIPRIVAGIAAGAAAAVKRCAIYTRKSKAADPEDEFSSLEAQRETCEAYVRARARDGWRVLGVPYDDDGRSGKNLERRAFRNLTADIVAGHVDVVVVAKLDRLSRSLHDFTQVMKLFEKHGVAFCAVSLGFSTTDAIGRMVLNMLMTFAEFEREMISERTRDKLMAARRRGKWTGGCVPLGYKTKGSKLVPDAETAPAARRAFDTYVQRRSILEVVRLLDEIAPRTTRVGMPRPWSRNDVRRMLTNPIYAGMIRVPDGTVVQGEHEALIDRSVFDLAAGKRGITRHAPPDGTEAYFLRGLLRCGCCDATLNPATTRKKRLRFRYYRCMTRSRRGASSCPLKPVRAEDIEQAVIGAVQKAVCTSEIAGAVVDDAHHQLTERRTLLEQERTQLPKAMADHTRRADDVAGMLPTATGADRAAADEALTEALAAAASVERRRIEVDAELRSITNAEADFAWVRETLEQFDLVWSALAASERVRLMELLFERVVVKQDRGVDLVWRSFGQARP